MKDSSSIESIRQNIKDKLAKFRSAALTNYSFLLVSAAVIGIVVGFVSISFHYFIERLNTLIFSISSFFSFLPLIVFVPFLGMLLQGLLYKFFPKDFKRRSVTDIIVSILYQKGNIKLKDTLINFLGSGLSLSTGLTLGPEGPAAQIGSGISSNLARLIKIHDEKVKIFTVAGASAAISSIFNAPLAGVFFSIELILLNDIYTTYLSVIIVASVSSTAITRAFLGDLPILIIPAIKFTNYASLYIFILIGIISGLFSIVFLKYQEVLKVLFNRLFLRFSNQKYLIMGIIGLIFGFTSLYFPEIFGIGYNSINKLFISQFTAIYLIIVFLLKFIFIGIIYNSGAFGGLFAPALFLGAFMGSFIFHIINPILEIQSAYAAVVLSSMGAFLAGIHSIPITAMLLIFEISRDYTMILPLMLAVITSNFFVQIYYKTSISIYHLKSQGIKIDKSKSLNILMNYTLSNIKLEDPITIVETEKINKIIEKFLETGADQIYVVSDHNSLKGKINEKDIRIAIREDKLLSNILLAKDIFKEVKFKITVDKTLYDAFILMIENKLDELPVVSLTGNKLLGIIKVENLLVFLSTHEQEITKDIFI
ncbi:MAG: chloride channel protein [Ignavibacteria bacterium]